MFDFNKWNFQLLHSEMRESYFCFLQRAESKSFFLILISVLNPLRKVFPRRKFWILFKLPRLLRNNERENFLHPSLVASNMKRSIWNLNRDFPWGNKMCICVVLPLHEFLMDLVWFSTQPVYENLLSELLFSTSRAGWLDAKSERNEWNLLCNPFEIFKFNPSSESSMKNPRRSSTHSICQHTW